MREYVRFLTVSILFIVSLHPHIHTNKYVSLMFLSYGLQLSIWPGWRKKNCFLIHHLHLSSSFPFCRPKFLQTLHLSFFHSCSLIRVLILSLARSPFHTHTLSLSIFLWEYISTENTIAAPNLHATITMPYKFIYHNLAKRSFNSFFKIYCLHLKCAKRTTKSPVSSNGICYVRPVSGEVRVCGRSGMVQMPCYIGMKFVCNLVEICAFGSFNCALAS